MFYPRTKFVDQNDIGKQISHVLTEAQEVVNEKMSLPHDYKAMARELVDLQHSADTALRILQEKHRINVDAVRAAVITNNKARGYYGV